MCWVIDIEIHFESIRLTKIIKQKNSTSSQDKKKATIFICRHLDECLKCECLIVKDPSILWKNFKERFDHQKEVVLPAIRDEWNVLHFQDFKKINNCNSAMLRIVLQLKFCEGEYHIWRNIGENFTFHASYITLQQQYRLRGFKKYSKLNSSLFVAKKIINFW